MKAIILIEPSSHPLSTVHGVVLVNDDEVDEALDVLREADSERGLVFETMSPDTLESTAAWLREVN